MLKKMLSIFSLSLICVLLCNMYTTAIAYSTNDSTFKNKSTQQTPALKQEIISMRTEYSKTFITTDGGYYTVVSDTPLHYKDENGNYQNIGETTPDWYPGIYSGTDLFVGEHDKLVENVSFQLQCFNKDSADPQNKCYVQGLNKGDNIICIKPDISLNNIVVSDAGIGANGLGISNTVDNVVAVKRITTHWNTNIARRPETQNCSISSSTAAKANIPTSMEWDIRDSLNSWILDFDENNGFALVAQ